MTADILTRASDEHQARAMGCAAHPFVPTLHSRRARRAARQCPCPERDLRAGKGRLRHRSLPPSDAACLPYAAARPGWSHAKQAKGVPKLRSRSGYERHSRVEKQNPMMDSEVMFRDADGRNSAMAAYGGLITWIDSNFRGQCRSACWICPGRWRCIPMPTSCTDGLRPMEQIARKSTQADRVAFNEHHTAGAAVCALASCHAPHQRKTASIPTLRQDKRPPVDRPLERLRPVGQERKCFGRIHAATSSVADRSAAAVRRSPTFAAWPGSVRISDESPLRRARLPSSRVGKRDQGRTAQARRVPPMC